MAARTNATPVIRLTGAAPGQVDGPFHGMGEAAGAYQSTDIGKLVMAALIDAHNNLVTQLDATKAAADRAPVATWETATRLNLRSGPGTDSAVLTTLPKGTSIRPIGDQKDEWWEVKANGYQGWLSSNYIVETE